MEPLKKALSNIETQKAELPEDVRYLPDDYECPDCRGLILSKISERFMEYRGDAVRLFPKCVCKAQAEREKADLKRAMNLPVGPKGDRTFKSFDSRPGTGEARRLAIRFAEGKLDEDVLVLVGMTGSGKTHLLEAIGHHAADMGQRPRYELVGDYLNSLRASFNYEPEEDTETIRNRCLNAELLLLDEIGVERGTDFAVEEVMLLVDERIRSGRRMAVATNETYETLMVKDNGAWFRVASRLYDEHSGVVKVAILTVEKDYRIYGR